MRRYTYTFLRDYFSAQGFMLVRRCKGYAEGQGWNYRLTNGARNEYFGNLEEVRIRAGLG